MEPSSTIYVKNHQFFDSKGTELEISRGLEQHRYPINDEEVAEEAVASVYLAQGIHSQVTPDIISDLPRRYEKGSVKAKATWFGALCLAGVGMFVEAFVIITTGQIKTVWHDQYPTCWIPDKEQTCPELIECCGVFPQTPDDICFAEAEDVCPGGTYSDDVQCSERLTGSVSYAEFAGIMAGMLLFGYVGDLIGRRAAGVLTSVCMIVGISFMTFFNSSNLRLLFSIFSTAFAVFGLGVGGEYPLTASGAAQHHLEETEELKAMTHDEKRRYGYLMEHAKTARRGETIALVFTMQGVGAVIGSLFLICLIYFSGQSFADCGRLGANSSGNNADALDAVWRSFYFIGFIFVIMLFIYRTLILEEGDSHSKLKGRKTRRQEKLQKTGNSNTSSTWKILSFYAPRLIGTGGSWLVWDVAFYGLKLFSGPIFDAINPNGDLMTQNLFLLLNNVIALVGYYAAAAVIDKPSIGRKKLQMMSFAMTAILFSITAGVFNTAPTAVVMILFFASSFFGQFGSNVTTYVMAAETYPSELRSTCHGLSAFMGKIGALSATIGFHYLSTVNIFWVCAGTSIAGLFFTFVFSVDLTHVSLSEHDAQLELLLEGRADRYKGKLNDAKHLSNFERWTGLHGEYDPNCATEFLEEVTVTRVENHIGGGNPISRESGSPLTEEFQNETPES